MKNDYKVSTNSKNVKEFIISRNFIRSFLGVLIGGTAGFLYYHFVGCNTGSCPITSHPYTTIIFGGLIGFIVTS
jgi:hypothetical protein